MFKFRSEWSVTFFCLKILALLTKLAFVATFVLDVLLDFDLLGVTFFDVAFWGDDLALAVFVFAFDVDFFVVVAIPKSVSSLFHF